jgi:hypothetical protein
MLGSCASRSSETCSWRIITPITPELPLTPPGRFSRQRTRWHKNIPSHTPTLPGGGFMPPPAHETGKRREADHHQPRGDLSSPTAHPPAVIPSRSPPHTPLNTTATHPVTAAQAIEPAPRLQPVHPKPGSISVPLHGYLAARPHHQTNPSDDHPGRRTSQNHSRCPLATRELPSASAVRLRLSPPTKCDKSASPPQRTAPAVTRQPCRRPSPDWCSRDTGIHATPSHATLATTNAGLDAEGVADLAIRQKQKRVAARGHVLGAPTRTKTRASRHRARATPPLPLRSSRVPKQQPAQSCPNGGIPAASDQDRGIVDVTMIRGPGGDRACGGDRSADFRSTPGQCWVDDGWMVVLLDG